MNLSTLPALLAPLFVAGSLAASDIALDARIHTALMVFEGFSAEAYIDTTGHLTIGHGHKLSAEYICHAPIDRAQAYSMLCADVEKAAEGAALVYPDFAILPAPAQEALIHMAFQLGTNGLSRFVNLKKAITLKNWSLAGTECIHSRWASQTPERARFCAALFGSIK